MGINDAKISIFFWKRKCFNDFFLELREECLALEGCRNVDIINKYMDKMMEEAPSHPFRQ